MYDNCILVLILKNQWVLSVLFNCTFELDDADDRQIILNDTAYSTSHGMPRRLRIQVRSLYAPSQPTTAAEEVTFLINKCTHALLIINKQEQSIFVGLPRRFEFRTN